MSFQILQRAYAPYGTAAQFPASGDSRLIYRATDTGYLYTWDASESAYKLAGIDPATAPYLGLHAQADDAARLGGQLPSAFATASHTHSGYEAAIGNPSVSGYLLSSTTAGVRSWVAPYSHPATHAQSVIDSSTGWITTALAGKQAAGAYLTTTGTAADSAKLGGQLPSYYAKASHVHNYAGSSSPGGAATSALACTGNAATATKWATARSVTLSGVVTGSASIDGSADATMNTSIADGALPIAKTSGLQNALDDKVSVSATGLGIVGNGSVGTLSTPADWAAIPVGCSRIYNGTTATGFPGDWPWYVTKIANRDMSGGYCVMAVDFLYAGTYMGCAGTSADYPTWKQLHN